MTQDDRTGSDPQGGLPQDAGNGMSDRAGAQDDSESGMTDTPVATGTPTTTDDRGASGPSDGVASTGTTFGTGGDDKGM